MHSALRCPAALFKTYSSPGYGIAVTIAFGGRWGGGGRGEGNRGEGKGGGLKEGERVRWMFRAVNSVHAVQLLGHYFGNKLNHPSTA